MDRFRLGVSKENVQRQQALDRAKVANLPDFPEPKMAQQPLAVRPEVEVEPASTSSPPKMATTGWLARIQENAQRLELVRQQQEGEI